MAKIFGFSTDRIASSFEAMTEREKKMTLFFAAAVLVTLIGGTFYWVFSNASDRRAEIDELQKYSTQISEQRQEYLNSRARNGALKKAMASNRTNLFGAVQAAASRLQLPPVQIEEMPVESKGAAGKGVKIREERVRFSLRELSIDRLTAFLEELEGNSSEGVTKVIQMNIRTSFKAPDLVDVQNMIVATWKQG